MASQRDVETRHCRSANIDVQVLAQRILGASGNDGSSQVDEGAVKFIPAHFIDQLRDIVQLRPQDIKFRVEAHAGAAGYGVAYCLEDRCRPKNKSFELRAGEHVSDGGKSCGIGDLFSLTWHQTESPCHIKSLAARKNGNAQGRDVPAGGSTKFQYPVIATSSSLPGGRRAPEKPARALPAHAAAPRVPEKKQVSEIIVIPESDEENENVPTLQISAGKGKQRERDSAKSPQAKRARVHGKNAPLCLLPSSPTRGSLASTLNRYPASSSQNPAKPASSGSSRSLASTGAATKSGSYPHASQIHVVDDSTDDEKLPDVKTSLLSSPRWGASDKGKAVKKEPVISQDVSPRAKEEDLKGTRTPVLSPAGSSSSQRSRLVYRQSSPVDSGTIAQVVDRNVKEVIESTHPRALPSVKREAHASEGEEENFAESLPTFAAVPAAEMALTPRQRTELVDNLARTRKTIRRLEEENRVARISTRFRPADGTATFELRKREQLISEMEQRTKAWERELAMGTCAMEEDEEMEEDELLSDSEDIKPIVKVKPDPEDSSVGFALPQPSSSTFSTKRDLSIHDHFGQVGGVAGPSSQPGRIKREGSEAESDDAEPARTRPKTEEDDDSDVDHEILREIDDIALKNRGQSVGYLPANSGKTENVEDVGEDMREFLKQAMSKNNFDNDVTVEHAMELIGLKDLKDKLNGTNMVLYPHQVLGVAFMLGQERKRKYKGGILADEMGLGKTVQLIALLTQNPSSDSKEKTTLIIAPLALLEQWREEIVTKTSPKLSVYVYHGAGRTKSLSELRRHDVVLTTLGTLATEWVADDEKARHQAKAAAKKKGFQWDSDGEDETKWLDSREQKSVLFKNVFHRVVIDEAQQCRNKATKGSRCVTGLQSELRWCLSGTPVTNKLEDLYGLLRFLSIKPFNNWEAFRDRISKMEKRRPQEAAQRAQAILKHICLRRTKTSTLNGKPLIVLPKKDVHLQTLQFSEEEREVYSFVELRSQARFNRLLRQGLVMKNYASVLVMLLRLRQLCGHHSLILDNPDEAAFEDPEREAKEKEAHLQEQQAKAIKILGEAEFERKRQQRLRKVIDRIQREKEAVDSADPADDETAEECCICFEPMIDTAQLTKCNHLFCKTCLAEFFNRPGNAADDDAVDGNERQANANARPCPSCRQSISQESSFDLAIFEPSKQELANATGDMEINDEGEEQEYNNSMNQVFKGIKPGSKSGSADKQKGQSQEKKKQKLQIKDDSDSDMERLAADSPESKDVRRRKSQKKGNAAKKRIIVDTDDEDSDRYESDFIDDEGAEPYTKNRKTGKNKGRALSVSSDSEAIDVDDIVTSGDDLDDDVDVAKTFRKDKGKGRADNQDQGGLNFRYRKFIPSSKLIAMLNIVQEAPQEDKFLLISQWTSMLSLVEAYLREHKIPFLTYQGSMGKTARDEAIRKFEKSPKYKALLMSLKAGGVGLNLAAANRVVVLDLAWSPAVENQAIDRIARITQKKEMVVSRLVIANTVEDRILTLQQNKQMLSDIALGEGKGMKMGKLGIKELKQLFGVIPMPERQPVLGA